MTEEELIAYVIKAKGGDQEAVYALYNEYKKEKHSKIKYSVAAKTNRMENLSAATGYRKNSWIARGTDNKFKI